MTASTREMAMGPIDDMERARLALYKLYMAALRMPDQVEELDGEDGQEEAAESEEPNVPTV